MEMFEAQGIKADEIRIIGGRARSRLWRQIIADVCNKRIACPLLTQETGCLGAAIAAGGRYWDL